MHVSGFRFVLVGTETCTGTSLQMPGGARKKQLGHFLVQEL